ncbi:MAG: hypothetical protein AVDCRST_MAG53-3233, partial [uncultured Solirubrobacteraceae bacterium]
GRRRGHLRRARRPDRCADGSVQRAPRAGDRRASRRRAHRLRRASGRPSASA